MCVEKWLGKRLLIAAPTRGRHIQLGAGITHFESEELLQASFREGFGRWKCSRSRHV